MNNKFYINFYKKGTFCIYCCYKDYDEDGEKWNGSFSYTFYFIAKLGETASGYITEKVYRNLTK